MSISTVLGLARIIRAARAKSRNRLLSWNFPSLPSEAVCARECRAPGLALDV